MAIVTDLLAQRLHRVRSKLEIMMLDFPGEPAERESYVNKGFSEEKKPLSTANKHLSA